MRTSCLTTLSLPLVGSNRECRVMVTHLKQFCGIQQGAVELASTRAFLFNSSSTLEGVLGNDPPFQIGGN